MVLLRKQERKNYDIDKMSKTIFAREMEANKERLRERKKKERKRKAKKRRKEKKFQKQYLKKINKFLSNPDNVDGVFLKLQEIEEIVGKREANAKSSMYNSTFDTFENKLERLNKQLTKKINLNEEISPSDFPPQDVLCILQWCTQFSKNEKYLSENCSFGKFHGPQSCDQHRNIVGMHFENTMRSAIEANDDNRVKRLQDIIIRYNAINSDGEFDVFQLEADKFSMFADSYKRFLKSKRKRAKRKKRFNSERSKSERREAKRIEREKRVLERRNKKLLAKGVVPPVQSTGDISIDRQNRINRRYEQRILLETGPVVEPQANVPVSMDVCAGYVSSDTDDEEWGTYKEKVNEFSDCDSEEEFDAGF